jgi:Zn-dependent peptidase ImmA (M78 family)
MVKFPSMSRREINELAENIIKHLQPGVINGKEAFDIDRFIEVIEDVMEIDFDFTNELPPGVHGCTSTIDNKVLILSDLADDPFNKKYFRSTVAHEIGHVILHLPLLRKLCKDKTFIQKKEESKDFNLYSSKKLKPYEDPEWQAWEFAGSILMPRAALVKIITPGISFGSIADFFNVNEIFLKSRLRKLKMI